MVTVELPPTLEKRLWTVVQDSYNGDLSAAMAAFLHLHEKYAWKEQLRQDVASIRADVRRNGRIRTKTINDAIAHYRSTVSGVHA